MFKTFYILNIATHELMSTMTFLYKRYDTGENLKIKVSIYSIF